MSRPTARHAGALLALVALLACAGSPPAAATVVIAKDFAALCAEADLIFVGTVTAVEPRWSDPQRRAIETAVTFGDLTWVRGAPRDTVTLRFAGGSLDGLHEEIAGVPRFAVGERRVLFARAGEWVSPVVGFHQGVFQVVDGADGPVVLDHEARAVTAAGAALQRGAVGDRAGAVPLATFLDAVRARLATPGATP